MTPRAPVDHDALREQRIAKGWPGRALAAVLGVAPSTLYGWEKGDYHPSEKMAKRWAAHCAKLRAWKGGGS